MDYAWIMHGLNLKKMGVNRFYIGGKRNDLFVCKPLKVDKLFKSL